MKNVYRYIIEETIAKVVEVEASTEQEAVVLAYKAAESVEIPEYHGIHAELINVTEVKKPDIPWTLDPEYDNLLHWKYDSEDNMFSVVCLWFMEDDDLWYLMEAKGRTLQDAVEALDIMPWCVHCKGYSSMKDAIDALVDYTRA